MEGMERSRPAVFASVASTVASTVMVLAQLFSSAHAGIIPFDPFKSLTNEPVKSAEPPLKDMRVVLGDFVISSTWGSEAVGADLAHKDLRGIEAQPVNVVVSDSGVKVGATRSIQVPGTPRQPKMIQLRLTKQVGEGKKIDWASRTIDFWNGLVPKEIPDPTDPTRINDSTHGTHVAGIVGALNSEFGVSPYAEITEMDIFKGRNLFKEENLAAALNVLLDTRVKVDVMNMSHFIPSLPEVREPLHKLVTERDAIVVVAAGNSGVYMGRNHELNMARDLVVVGAYGFSGAITSFSNYGASVDLVAPGEGIVSRGHGIKWKSEDLELMSGTSMAAPYVTGTFASLRALLPNARASDLKKIVYRSVTDLGQNGKDYFHGRGLLNTLRATAVARRLLNAGLVSEGAIAQAVTVDDNFKFEEDARAAMIEARKAGMGSDEFEEGLRRQTLLLGTPEAMKNLGSYHILMGESDKGAGWLFAAANCQSNVPREQELETVALMTWETQERRRDSFDDNKSMFKSLSNVELALKVYEMAPSEVAPQITPFFMNKVASLDSSRMKDLGSLIAQKRIEPSMPGLIASISMGM